MERHSTDVVVIGAGVAGLVTAERLAAAGHDVLVLEGNDRVGGRTYTGELAGVAVDYGAAFVGPQQERVHALLARLGLELEPVHHRGRHVQWIHGRRRTYRGTIPWLPPAAMVDYARVEWKLRRLIGQVRVGAPWLTPDAERVDALSLGGWLRAQHARPSTLDLFGVVSRVLWACEPDDISALQAARFVAAAGGLDVTLGVEGGGQQDHVVGGFQSIALALAARLGDRVLTGRPVRSVTARPDGGVLVRADGVEVGCRYVVCAVQATHRAAITFEPALPERHRILAQRWKQTTLTKALLAYPTPFWREDGLSGSSVVVGSPLLLTFDLGPAGGPGILMAFVDHRAFDALPADRRRELVVSQVEQLFGPRARTPLDYVDHRWSVEPFAPGAPMSLVPPHGVTQHAAVVKEPVGPVHWAGTDTADEFVGYVEGAVRSGERAADEVAGRLAAHATPAIGVRVRDDSGRPPAGGPRTPTDRLVGT